MRDAGSRGVACRFMPVRAPERLDRAGRRPTLAVKLDSNGRPQTGHLQSATTRAAPFALRSGPRGLSAQAGVLRDLPTLSVAPDLFQRSQVEILPPLRISGSEIADLRA